MRRRWNSTQPNDGMTLDHVIRCQIKSLKVQLSRRLQSLNVVVIHQNETLPFLYVTWCNHVVTWQTSENAYQNRRVPLLHSMRPNHAEVIKAAVPKFALMKATDCYRARDPDKWRASNHNFYKSFKALKLKDKNLQ